MLREDYEDVKGKSAILVPVSPKKTHMVSGL